MTYSIVARCPNTGRLAVGVASHYPATGSIVSWVQAGAGAVGTQGNGNQMYGARGLELLAAGVDPTEAMEQLLRLDDFAEHRQVAFVDARGRIAAHTGDKCIQHAGHVLGDGVVFQVNMMRNPGAAELMADSWSRTASESVEVRILEALQLAERAGGDIRGRQSAGLKVTDPVNRDVWWEGTWIDLRVDDHPDPLSELERLVRVRIAYRTAKHGEDYAALGDVSSADQAFDRARLLSPESTEITFWHGVALANSGKLELAKEALRIAYAEHDGWRELVRRLPAAGFLMVNEETVEELATA